MSVTSQWAKEQALSYKEIKNLLELEFICSPLLDDIASKLEHFITTYKNSLDRYASKDALVETMETNLENIPLDLVIALFTLGETTLQALAYTLGSRYLDDKLEAVKLGAMIVCLCKDLCYTLNYPSIGGETFTITPTLTLPKKLIDRIHSCCFLPPMLSLPDAWTTAKNGGYYTHKEHAILGDKENRQDTLNLKVLNILQEVAYTLDSNITCLDDTKPSFTSAKDERSYDEYAKKSKEIYKDYLDKKFYFTHHYDKRGRVYARGYHINPQGNEYRKAMLTFAKEVSLTNEGMRWFKIDLANHYGLDKLTFDERVEFIDDHIDRMLQNKEAYIDKASDKYLFRATLLRYEKALRTGKTNHIVRLDATCSGPQIMSVVTRDTKAMKLFNVLGEAREDYYTLVAKETYAKTKNSPLWIGVDFKEIRKTIKDAVMTFYYNSTLNPKRVFGDDTHELHAFYNTLLSLTKGACHLKQIINGAWNAEALYHRWLLPDFHLSFCPTITKHKSRITIKDGLPKPLTFTFIYSKNTPDKSYLSLAPNIVHSLDAYILREVVTALHSKGVELSVIHDSFGVNPNDCALLRQAYRETLAKLYKEPIIDDILEQITGKPTTLEKEEYKEEVYQAILSNDKGHYLC